MALAADAFAALEERGIFDPATARAFRDLLEKGRSVDPTELQVKFPGTEAVGRAAQEAARAGGAGGEVSTSTGQPG